jgi:uncharacterized protein
LLAVFYMLTSLFLEPAGASAKTRTEFSALPTKSAPALTQTTFSIKANIADAGTLSAPMIALIIDDIGPARQWSNQALALPAPVTMAVLPYVADAPEWAARAQAKGHSVLLHMPMEPLGLEDPGPGALLERLSVEQNRQRLSAALMRLPGVVGVNNHMGSRFTTCLPCMSEVADLLQGQGLMFLDSVTSGRSKAASRVSEVGGAVLRRDVFLDDDASPQAIARQIQLAEEIAYTQGVAVVIAHPRPETIAALTSWVQVLESKGIQLVALRTALKRKQALSRGLRVRAAGL